MSANDPTPHLESSDRPHAKGLHKWLLQGIGWVCVVLALAGIPLPLLPTTPFLLLAGACFIRSSPALHRRLQEDPRIGPYIRQWNRDHSIPRGARRRAYLLVVISFSLSIALIESVGLRVMLGVFAAGLLWFLSRLKAKDEGQAVSATNPISTDVK